MRLRHKQLHQQHYTILLSFIDSDSKMMLAYRKFDGNLFQFSNQLGNIIE